MDVRQKIVSMNGLTETISEFARNLNTHINSLKADTAVISKLSKHQRVDLFMVKFHDGNEWVEVTLNDALFVENAKDLLFKKLIERCARTKNIIENMIRQEANTFNPDRQEPNS